MQLSLNSLLEKKILLEDVRSFYKALCLAAFFILSFILFTLQSPGAIGGWCAVAMVYINFLFKDKENFNIELNFTSAYILLIFFAALIDLPFAIYRGPQNIGHFFILASSLLISYKISKDAKVLFWSMRFALVLMQVAIVAYISSYSGKDPLGNLVPGVSYNGVTSYLVVLQCAYSAVSFCYKRLYTLLTPLVTMYICYIGFGRGSIISGLLLIACVYFFFFLSLTNRKKLVVGFTFLILMTILYKLFGDAFLNSYKKTKFAAGFYAGQRPWIWNDYFVNANPIEIIFGRDFKGLVSGEFFSGNPHNTFIRSHNKFGLPYVLLILVAPFLYYYSKEKLISKLYVVSLFLVIFIRAMTETILFPTVIDVFFYSALIYILSNNEIILRNKNVD